MVEFATARLTPQARSAGSVSSAGSDAIKRLGQASQGAANTFTEFYEKEAAIQGERLLAEIQEEWGRTYNDRSKGAGSGFAKTTMADYDSFVSQKLSAYDEDAKARGQANVPERNRDDVQLALDKYRMRLETKSMAREAAARAAAKNAAVAATKRAKMNAMISDPSLYGEYMETANKKDGEAYTRTMLAMQVRDNPQGVLDDVMAGQYDTYLQPSQKMSFIKLADSGVARIERENEVQMNAARKRMETALGEETAFAQANGAPPVDSAFDADVIKELYATDPERGEAVVDAYNSEIDFAEIQHGVAMADPADIDAQFAAMNAAVEKPGNTPRDVSQRNSFVAAVQQRSEALRTDAANHVNKSEVSIGDMYGEIHSADPEDQPIIANMYVDAQEFEYDRLGVPDQFRTVLPKADAVNQVAQFNDMGSDVAASALSNYLDIWGDASPMVMRQLEKAGLAPEYSVAMRHLDNPGLSQSVINLKGVTTAELETGLLKESISAADVGLRDAMIEYRAAFELAGGPDAADMLNKHYGVADRLILSRIRTGADVDDAVADVVAQMFPETVVSESSGGFVLPVGVDESAISNATDYAMTAEATKLAGVAVLDDPRFPEFVDVELSRASLELNGFWVNNSTGDGLQLMYQVDGSMIPAMLENGKPYSLTFDDLVRGSAIDPAGRLKPDDQGRLPFVSGLHGGKQ